MALASVIVGGKLSNLIMGIGIDLVDIEKMKNAIQKRGEQFQKKVFTKQEIEYCYRRRNPFPHLAVRFAAKEAVLKAFGLGFGKGGKWTDIEIVIDDSGKPEVKLSGFFKDMAKERGLNKTMVSLSHTKQYATAIAILTN